MRTSFALCCVAVLAMSGCINRAGADMTACRMARVACESRTRQLEGELAKVKKAPSSKKLPPDGHVRAGALPGALLKPDGFTLLDDRGDKALQTFRVQVDETGHLLVTRRVAAAMQYDGYAGLNVITIRRVDGRSREVYSAALLGQYPLAGYYLGTDVLLAWTVEQVGAMPYIRALVGVDTRKRRMHTIGPRGAYRYASVSPDGRLAVLVDHQIVVLDILQNRAYVVPGASVKAEAHPGQGNQVGGGYDLSGKHLRFTWSGAGGVLVGTDAAGKEVDRIKLTVEPARLTKPVDRPAR